MKTTVITPTIGTKYLEDAIISVRDQSVECKHLVVIDGLEYFLRITDKNSDHKNMDVLLLTENTGLWNGQKWNGHRIYSGIPAIVNTEFVCFLDEDNYMAPDYVEVMEKILTDNPHLWVATCRRHVVREDKSYIGVDNFESIGENHMGYALHDTNTYMFRTEVYCSIFAPHFYDTLGADKILTEQVLKFSHTHKHIADPLVYYRSPKRLTKFFEGGCDK